ncbi:MAG: hypothetical protein M3076_11030 [Actinomycetota bacterium]|nr:hypothetical protein [Actinomycetota bacterium]
MRAWEKWSTVALGLVLVLLSWTATPAAGHSRRSAATGGGAPTITLAASRRNITSGHALRLSGRATGVAAGTQVRLYQTPFPFRAAKLVQTTVTATNSTFSFSVSPDRDSRYTVQLAGTAARAQIGVGVGGRTVTKVTALSLGRAQVTILVHHPGGLRWAHARVQWSYGSGARGRFATAPPTRSSRLSRYVTMLRSTVTLPAGPFRWRTCLHVPQAQALLNPRRPPGCRGRGYYGGGRLPFGYPAPSAVARAAAYLGGRIGRTAFAVVDSEGRLSGIQIHRTFVSASAVKAMLLVAYLRRLDARGQHTVDPASNSFLYPMINVSDNNAATHTWSIVGNSGLYAMAHTAGMTDYSVSTDWASSQISAADQARFFFAMDSLIPREFVGYARRLLSTIAGFESWGIPAVARPLGYTVFFKGGWRGTGLGQLVHQIGRLEGHSRTFSIAVMTDGDPSMGYGISTIQGVTGALL